MVENADITRVTRQSFIWNIVGSIIGAASSFVLLLCVTRTVGAVEGGIFSLAFATSQILLTVGKFGVRSFQATDVRGEIETGVYLQTRIWFCAAMLFLSILYIGLAGYDSRKSAIFIFVCIMKMADAIEDVFHGQLQSYGYMEVGGKLLTLRNTVTMLVFGVCMWGFRDLLISCFVAALISVFLCIAVNVFCSRKYFYIKLSFDKEQSIALIKACFPLFAGSFLSLFIYNMPKYAIEFWGSEQEITYYSIIFMPTFVINLFSEFVFKPLLTKIAYLWDSGQRQKFGSTIKKLLANIILFTMFAMFMAYRIGAEVLSILYAVDVNGFKTELVALMLAGGFSAAAYLLYNVLTSMRRQKIIFINYGLVSLLVLVLACLIVPKWQIAGATLAYLISEIILLLLMLVSVTCEYRKEN